ncbi:MAG: molybdopterin molybdotransferase MoeA, partial [Brachybacterium sp.]|nr:molybdopterin molybdotransferase MoeA [Brachybacterium sp.]
MPTTAHPHSDRIPLEDHVADATALLAAVRRSDRTPLHPQLVGRIAAAERRARVDVPAVDNSQMDGFAVRAADLETARASAEPAPVTLPLGEMIAAGDAPSTLPAGTARPIMTGAPVPVGADLVVPVEESSIGAFGTGRADDGEAQSTITLTPRDGAPGRYVRPAGSDTRAGDTVLRPGDTLTPARLAHLAACGITEVEVEERLRTVVLSTGSEVTDPGGAAAPGTAYDANGPGLAAALIAAGADVIAVDRVPDDPDVLLQALERHAAEGAELLVTSGGVSAGAVEVVRLAAEREPVRLSFVKVAMQPGGPQAIGTFTASGGQRLAWLAFPGNPVSALLSAELIARPALGAPPRRRLRLPVRLATASDADDASESSQSSQSSPVGLAQYRRARLLP